LSKFLFLFNDGLLVGLQNAESAANKMVTTAKNESLTAKEEKKKKKAADKQVLAEARSVVSQMKKTDGNALAHALVDERLAIADPAVVANDTRAKFDFWRPRSRS
jgi:hypothetical protein